jgi:Family of unknown function (DUF6624)
MRRRAFAMALVAALSELALTSSARAQTAADSCGPVVFVPSKAPTVRSVLSRVEGQAVFAPTELRWETGWANDVCIVLFDEAKHRRLAAVTANGQGQFDLGPLPPGRYALVAAIGDLKPLTVLMDVVANSSGRPDANRRLVLHMRMKDDPRPAYSTQVREPALRAELIARADQDQRLRNEMIKNGSARPDSAVVRRMAALDAGNTTRLKEIVEQIGWPGTDLVGWDGAEAAFLLGQHAERDAHKAWMPKIQEAFETGRISGSNYALFLDRYLVEDGKPQVYGSRARPFAEWKGRTATFFPIDDSTSVDKRRADVGLSPLAVYAATLSRMYFPEGKKPL